ncbi:phage baseplate assembly protein [Rhizobium sp. C1]|uniref:phage baseplate assembly protein n=1 Tax=Rhizobium sp. C1 TaxID=1349799 RepID=UPI001E3A7A2C|nr:Mu P family protein [Rhizobium sp. C1]MCD2176438.1 Mu P family protein [Rhizobium sp. C1]
MIGEKGIRIWIEGREFKGAKEKEVSLDMEDFSASFSFTCRDQEANADALVAALGPWNARLKAQKKVKITVSGQLVLVGKIEKRSSEFSDQTAEITLSGRCKAGDMVDCAAMTKGPAEFKNVKLEDAAKKIAAPYGLGVRSEIDTGEPFPRYSLDLAETAHRAIEKGARQRQALAMSDGIGNIVITRAGSKKAAGAINAPGNVKSVSMGEDCTGRFSETIVHGQHEKAGKERKGDAALDKTAEPLTPAARAGGDGEATKQERKGTVAKGVAKDEEVEGYRPKVYLARTKAEQMSAQEEAEWRRNTARGKGEQITYVVYGHDVDGELWRPNTIAPVKDRYNAIDRDMLISKVRLHETEDEAMDTELTVTSPEAFAKSKGGGTTGGKGAKSRTNKASGKLDTTAERL